MWLPTAGRMALPGDMLSMQVVDMDVQVRLGIR